MARKIIDTFWDRASRNDINDNFEELYKGITGEIDMNRLPDKSISSSKLDDKSVTPSKTTFFTAINGSRNLFDGIYRSGILFNDPDSDKLIPVKDFSSYKGVTAVIKISPNTTYTVKVHDDKEDVFRVGVSNKAPKFVARGIMETDGVPLDKTIITSGVSDPKREEVTFNSGANGNYLSVYVSNRGSNVPLQVEEGDKATPFSPGMVIRSEYIEKTPVKINELDFVKRSSNVFDGTYTNGILFNHDDGLIPVNNFSGYKGKTAIIEVEPNTDYAVKVHDAGQEVFRAGLSKNEPQFVPRNDMETGGIPLDTMLITSGVSDPKKEEVSFKTGPNEKYLVVYVSNNGDEPPLQVEKGTSYSPYQAPYVIENGYVEHLGSDNDNRPDNNYFAFYEELKGIYEYNGTIEGVEEGSEIDIKMKSSEWLWGHYDDLMSANPEYISRRRIGYGSALDGSEDTSLPIYEYSFNPARSHATHEVHIPIMLIQSGFHGHEKAAAWATYLFFKQLCESKETDDVMNFLRYNIDFRVVPIINKWGFDRYIRKNVRDIDMNNNFETDFTIVYEDSSYYGGTEPMTEQETLTMDRWYQEFAHDNNVIGLVDMHNFISLPLGLPYLSWNLSRHVGVRTMMLNIGTHLDRKWRGEFPGVASNYPEGEQLQYTGQRISGTGRNQAYMKYGIKSVTIDPLKRIKIIDGSKDNDKYAVQVSLDLLGATVVGLVKNFAM